MDVVQLVPQSSAVVAGRQIGNAITNVAEAPGLLVMYCLATEAAPSCIAIVGTRGRLWVPAVVASLVSDSVAQYLGSGDFHSASPSRSILSPIINLIVCQFKSVPADSLAFRSQMLVPSLNRVRVNAMVSLLGRIGAA